MKGIITENTNYTDEEKIKALQEISKAMKESLMCVIAIDITIRDKKLSDEEKIVETARLIKESFTFQPVVKKYDLISLLR